jgi:hypothetical protein
MRDPWRLLPAALLTLMAAGAPPSAQEDPSEYRLKAAFLYNFVLFTEWPADTGRQLNVCVYGSDPFGAEIDGLQGKPVGERLLAVRRISEGGSVSGCQIVFVSPHAIGTLAHLLQQLRGSAALIVADSPGAAQRGAALNMSVSENKVTFEANLAAARSARVNLSSKLLRLATHVIQ